MNSNRVIPVVLMFFLSLFTALPSMAQEKALTAQVDLSAEERAFIAGKQLRLGVDIARPPFEYVDGKGTYTGISAEFIGAAAKKLGITIVPQKEIKWTDAMEKVKVGEIDVIPKVTPSAAREKFMIFTKPYTTFPSVIVTRKERLAGGMDDLRGLKVGVNKGQIVEANLKRDHPEFSLFPYPDIESGLRALSTGECDAYIDNLGAVAYTVDTVGLTNLRIAASTPYTHDLAFGVRKDWPLLALALDKALASMTDQEKAEIKNRWLAIKYDAGINWRIFGPIGAALLVIITFVLVWNRRLERAIRERERGEKKINAMGEALPDALVMIDSYGKVLFWNQAAVRLFGYTPKEAMGMDFHEMAAPTEVREKAHAGIRQFAATGKGILFGAMQEVTAINRMGKAFPVEVNLSPFQVGEKRFAVGIIRDITQRKQMDEKLEKSKEDLQNQIGELGKTRKAMLNIMEDLEVSKRETESTMHKINAMSQAVNDALVMINGQGKVLFWNQAAEKLFGYTVSEAMGMDFHEIGAPPDVREKARLAINRFGATGQGDLLGVPIETTAINRAGKTFPVEVNLSPFQVNEKWFAVGTVRDITERKAAEESLRQAGNEQVAIFESLTLGIAFIKDRIILRGNTKLGELFGRPLDEMIGQTTRIWYKNEEEYLGIGASTYEDLKRQAIHQREQQLPRKDGSLFWCLFRVRAVDVHDISQGIVCTLEDITERKQAEKELKERMEELERFSRLTINREEKMIQLKEEINTLQEQMGKEKKYKIVE